MKKFKYMLAEFGLWCVNAVPLLSPSSSLIDRDVVVVYSEKSTFLISC